MSKHKHHDSPITDYKQTLYELRVQLVKLQSEVIRRDLRIVVLMEGRDGAGKDGAIKRIVKHMSPRETRVVALARPSDRDESSWYFQRYAPHLPAGGEIVLFNRSWYNRAGVEVVMGFCTAAESEAFMHDAPAFEQLLVRSGIMLRKFYLDIGKGEQTRRLSDRRDNPLKQWKLSSIDEVAVANWDKYSAARNEMLARTSTAVAPWTVIRTDDKRTARINIIRALLTSFDYTGKDDHLLAADREVVFSYGAAQARDPRMAP